MNSTNKSRGGSSNRGNHGGSRGGHNNAQSRPTQVEKPDHSPILGIQALITRLGDVYLTMSDVSQQHLYNHYHHQFDISLPNDPVLEPFYQNSTPLHTQLKAVGQNLKAYVKANQKQNKQDFETIFSTIFRSVVALPTKINIYAGLVAYLGMESPTFLQMIINETYKQLEASIRGLFVLMLMDDRKKHLNIAGTAKSKAQFQLIQELQLSSTPTTTITTPAITFEAMMKFIAALVGYHCIPTSTWMALLTSLLTLTNIPYHIPRDGNYDTLHEDTATTQYQPIYIQNAFPFELSNIGSLLEELSVLNLSSSKEETIIVKARDDEKEKTPTMNDKAEGDDSAKSHYEDDDDDVSSKSTSSSSLTTHQVPTSGALIQYTAFNDVIIHGLLSALTFASRDVLNFGVEWNKKHQDVPFFKAQGKLGEQLLNKDSILFNIVSNWQIAEASTNTEDVDVELDYDYQGTNNQLGTLSPTTDSTTDVVIDGINLQLTTIETFYVNIIHAISGYLFNRNTAFSAHNQLLHAQAQAAHLNPNAPTITTPSTFYNSPFSSHIASTFEFYSEPNRFQYDQTPSPALSAQDKVPHPFNTTYFDYLSWSFWAITGSLPDGKVHILRSQQLNKNNVNQNNHAWGLITRPFSIPTPSFRGFRKEVQQHYTSLTLSSAPQVTTTSKKDAYTFICPGPLDTKYVYIIPPVDMSKSSSGKKKVATTTTKKSSVPKLSKKLIDHVNPAYQSSLTSASTTMYYITQPACFPPLLSLLPHPKTKARPTNSQQQTSFSPLQSKFAILPHSNNIDVWLTYSYLFYSNITYAGLQEEYFSFISTLPQLYPVWGESQVSLYTQEEGTYVCKYAKQCTTTSLQRSMTSSTIPLLLSFFFSLLITTHNNFSPPLTSALLQVDSPALMHNELTASQSSYFSNTIIRLMYEFPSLIPTHFGPRFNQIFKSLQHLSLPSIHMFSNFLANYLCQFNFQFPFQIFKSLAEKNDPTHLQYNFVQYTLATCVKLTSFSTVASNVMDLWALLPPVKHYFDQAEYLKSVSQDVKPLPIASSDCAKLLIPQVITEPILNDAILILYNALFQKSPKSIILSTLFASQSFPVSTIRLFHQHLEQFPSAAIASEYAMDENANNNYFTVQQAAAFGLNNVININPFALLFFLAILAVSRKSNTHFSYYLTNYGDILALLCNTAPGDLLHDGLDIDGMNQDPIDAVNSNANVDVVDKLIMNSHFHEKPSNLPDQAEYQNGFVHCTLINNDSQPLKSSLTLQTLTATAAIPHPTQITILDSLLLFYHDDTSLIPIKLQLLLSNNIISIQSYFIWVLFYLPRYSNSSTTSVFSLNLVELIELGLNLYLMSNNEKEGKFIDLFKTTFASTSIQTILGQDTSDVIEIIPKNEINAQIIDKLQKILSSHNKITSFKSSLFSAIFSLIFDWVGEAPTVLGVLQMQAHSRAECLREYNPDAIEHDDGGSSDINATKRQRTQGEVNNDQTNIELLHGAPENFAFKSSQFLIFIITKYKLSLRNISADVVRTCQIPGLEAILRQIFE